MTHDELNSKFQGKDFALLFRYIIELDLGTWRVGMFWDKDCNPFVVMYCAEFGNVVMVEIESPDEMWDDALALIDEGGEVLNVYGHVVDVGTPIHDVMVGAMKEARREAKPITI